MEKRVGKWRGSAPSNIALIKYMGKISTHGNRPTNPSLSYTLPHLRTHVEMQLLTFDGGQDSWEPLLEPGLEAIRLSAKGVAKFLNHLDFLKKTWDFNGSFLVRSANDFPSDCGLASSASSFAALTATAARAMSELSGRPVPSPRELAEMSRHGSGSSCRSFFEPWALWSAQGAESIELGCGELIHQAIIVADGRKSVSSSEAHQRVTRSLLFEGRPARAEMRLQNLVECLRTNQWTEAMRVCWAEFWDMHALFETTPEPFGYMTAGSLEVLAYVRDEIWGAGGDGPIATMDAGANIHLLFRPEQTALADLVMKRFADRFRIVSSHSAAERRG